MSGIIKGIGKAFKSVTKVIKRVAPIALAIGAVVFTGGAALGALPAWGAAVAGVLGTSTLGTIAAGAITYAGYGAVAGAATAAVTGGSIKRGLRTGAAVGAIAGGAMGAFAPAATPVADPIGSFATSVGTPAAAAAPGAIAPTAAAAPSTFATNAAGGFPSAIAAETIPPAAGSTAATWGPAAAIVGGQALSGLGQGVANASAAKAETAFEREKLDRISQNYSGPPGARGLMSNSPAAAVANPQPGPNGAGRLIPPATTKGRWKFDPEEGQFVFEPYSMVA